MLRLFAHVAARVLFVVLVDALVVVVGGLVFIVDVLVLVVVVLVLVVVLVVFVVAVDDMLANGFVSHPLHVLSHLSDDMEHKSSERIA